MYGLRSSGARWRDHMANTIREAGYKNCYADPDVWMKAGKNSKGEDVWFYILCYVDDILCIDACPQGVMDYLASVYQLKKGSVEIPKTYLGAEIKQWYIKESDDPDKVRWAMSSDTYVQRAVRDVETELDLIQKKLPTKCVTPFSCGYRPELDGSKELDGERTNYFQGLIGVLRWICELGRIDILVPVSLMSRYLVSPREGHLQEIFHLFGYLKCKHRSTLVFDDTEPTFENALFKECDWKEFYPDAAEGIPSNAPEARGKSVSTTCFVDADHAGCQVTRRSHSGVILFVNRAPITWFSKRQNTVETSTFGSEFVAMRIAVELIEGLRYKLRMMGVPLDGATSVFCDNAAVVQNTTSPDSTLKKKHNAISYHRTREAIAAGTIKISKIDGLLNLADILTKLLAGPRLRELSKRILW